MVGSNINFKSFVVNGPKHANHWYVTVEEHQSLTDSTLNADPNA